MTRPQENTVPITKALLDMGHEILVDPLLHYVSVHHTKMESIIPSAFNSIVTTSQQAIRCLAEITQERDFPLWCVGAESASIATKLGFQNIHVAEGSAKSLIQNLQNVKMTSHDKPVLYLSGDVIRVDLVGALKRKGMPAKRIIVYNTQEATDLLQQTKEAIIAGQLDVILFYSARTAKVFRNLCQRANLISYFKTIMAVCLSQSIYNEIQSIPWKSARISNTTTTNDLLLALMMAD
jgi:uroporphyrinogen-III synthase